MALKIHLVHLRMRKPPHPARMRRGSTAQHGIQYLAALSRLLRIKLDIAAILRAYDFHVGSLTRNLGIHVINQFDEIQTKAEALIPSLWFKLKR